jgi:hypothetical protein
MSILKATDYIVNKINTSTLSVNIVAERVYIHLQRLEEIGDDVKIWVQPVEHNIEKANRRQDFNTYSIDIGVFGRCIKDQEVDQLVLLGEELYELLMRGYFEDKNEYEGTEDRYIIQSVEVPTLYSPDYLIEKNMFASVLSVNVKAMTPTTTYSS